jgi:hypothetical protein
VIRQEGAQWIYFQGSDGYLWNEVWAGNEWHAAEDYDSHGAKMAPNTTPAVIRQEGAQWIYFQGSDGYLWNEVWAGNEWHAAEDYDSHGAKMVPNTTPTVMREEGGGRQWIYYPGSDGYLWSEVWNGKEWEAAADFVWHAPNGTPDNWGLPAVTPTAPLQGTPESASTGSWSGAPTSYTYQWERCNASGGECSNISGATSSSYTPVEADVGHTLVVKVTAGNSAGSTSEASNPTGKVGQSYTQTIDSGNSLNGVSCIPSTTDCVTSDSKGNALYATKVSTTASATWTAWKGPVESASEAVDCPTSSLCLLADKGNMYYATSLGGTWTEAYSPSYGVDAISCASATFCVDGQNGDGYFRYATSPASTSWTLEDQGSAGMNGVSCMSSSFCAIVSGVGDVYVADTTSQIESSSWTATDVDGSSALHGVACASTKSCLAVDGAGNVLALAIAEGKATATTQNIDGTNDLTAIACSGSSTCVTVDSAGNIFATTNGGTSWSKEYATGTDLTSVSCASTSLCTAVDTTGKVTGFMP